MNAREIYSAGYRATDIEKVTELYKLEKDEVEHIRMALELMERIGSKGIVEKAKAGGAIVGKTVYVVSEVVMDMDALPVASTFSLESAQEIAKTRVGQLTAEEKQCSVMTIEGYKVDCPEDMDADDAYEYLLSESEEYPEPIYEEDITA